MLHFMDTLVKHIFAGKRRKQLVEIYDLTVGTKDSSDFIA